MSTMMEATRPADPIEAVVLKHLLPSGAHIHVSAQGKAAAHGHQDPHHGAHAPRALLLLCRLTACGAFLFDRVLVIASVMNMGDEDN